MNKLFDKDITIKIISVLLAIIFWLYVSNSDNPFKTIVIYDVPITIVNEDFITKNDYVLKNELRNRVDVTIRGRKQVIDNIRASDFEASLDLSQISSANDRKLLMPKPVCMQKGVTIVSYSPTAIDIRLARNKSDTFAVELKSNVTMKPGYVLLEAKAWPESVIIPGEESVIDSVGSIVANIEIKDLDRDLEKRVQCKVFDKAGSEISSLSNNLQVNVKLTVAKEVPVLLVTRGRLAADYVETLRIIEPTKVLVTGPVDILENTSGIKTDQVNIDKIEGNFTSSIPLVVPDGIKLVGTQKDVTVNINVEKLEIRNIELLNNDISLLNTTNDGSLQYEIKTEKLLLKVKGRQADINAIKLESMKPAVDVTGLTEGTHKLPLNITIPSQATLLQKVNVEVKIIKTAVTQEPAEQ